MATVTESPRISKTAPTGETRILLRGISWDLYQQLSRADPRRRVLMAYDRGDLELMSPGPIHEDGKGRLDRLVEILTEELGLPLLGLGSTTWDREEAGRGIESDECYYLTVAKMETARDLMDRKVNDAEDYPPPDLSIEIDLSPSALDRPSIYAALGVAEVWRYNGKRLVFEGLRGDGRYEVVSESRFLPVRPEDVVPWLEDREIDDNARARRVRAWVRAELLPRLRP